MRIYGDTSASICQFAGGFDTARLTLARDPRPVLSRKLAAARRSRRYEIGFPGAVDLTFPELTDWLTGQLLNNVGDPYEAGHGRDHTKDLEQQVIDMVADLLRAPRTRWGYVTTGSSEATVHALHDATLRFPDVVVYTSSAAHPSVAKAARQQRLPLIVVRARADGSMHVGDLAVEIGRRRDRAAIVVATAGTTMTEAVDDVAAIATVCADLSVRHRIHVDAALSGLPLALLPQSERPAFDFTAGATSMAISGHKFLGTLMPSGVLVYADQALNANGRLPYTGCADSTIGCSRSGHTPLLLWTSLTRLGTAGHAERADAARDLAAYTLHRLTELGWPASRNPQAFTVVLQPPPPIVRAKWVLADDGHSAHIVTMPGIGKDQIDEFIDDLAVAIRPRPALHLVRPDDPVTPALAAATV